MHHNASCIDYAHYRGQHHIFDGQHHLARWRNRLWTIHDSIRHRLLPWQRSRLLQVRCNSFRLLSLSVIACYVLLYKYRYCQKEMRNHLKTCLAKGQLTPFPSDAIRKKKPVKTEVVNIHCDCRMPEDGKKAMVLCGKCSQWYHQSCHPVAEHVFARQFKQKWYCNHCLGK